MADFELLETMKACDGHVYLLQRHLRRLADSAQYFDFRYDHSRLSDEIRMAAVQCESPAILRLKLSATGLFALERLPLRVEDTPRRLEIAHAAIDSTNPFLYHKTTNRTPYEKARGNTPAGTDVILVNERGEITETTIANLAVFRENTWITPALSCGLLPGTMRGELLAANQVTEGMIPSHELSDGQAIRCFNSVRGIFDVPVSVPAIR